eukprot:CAMPEP_0174890518 /NCGR_PEP_ID=MMETSP0167-20121228/5668_1 /TAXON_ID=38298 /ORGANISM="Rhodella maculata, Strain CCMP736" /LENGTH=66 /DNA_ID=CAMNT_0016128351 /DNA_START=195 /DNA_END=395 /DNA_ORIENTATION=+
MSKGRAALKHERVVKLLYCNVNLRLQILLEMADKDITNMFEDALEDALDEADAIAAGATTETVVDK